MNRAAVMSSQSLGSDFNGNKRDLWVHHDRVPGRTRLRSQGIFFHPQLLESLNKNLRTQGSIQTVSINHSTGSILVKHQAHVSGEAIRLQLAHFLAELLSIEDEQIAALQELAANPEQATEIAEATPADAEAKPSLLDLGKNLLAARRAQKDIADQQPNADAVTNAGAPEVTNWHAKSSKVTLQELDSQATGLSLTEVARRLQMGGKNQLPEANSRSDIAIFVDQFMNAPVAMLGVSAVVSVMLRARTDAMVIGGVVVVNALIGFFTERKAERTISSLSKVQASEATVIRDGKPMKVSATDVVVGDVVDFKPGAQIAADARLISGYRLSSDESALTGESLPVKKNSDHLCDEKEMLADRNNMVYMGTTVVGGSGQGVVVATGLQTELGQIQQLADTSEAPETPVQKQLNDAGTRLAILSSAVCGLVFVTGIIRGNPPLEMLKSSISLAVAAVPEGLPAIANSLLAKGIRDMRDHNVYARRLDAIENLGAVDVICMDKTGTLTENKMTVVEVVANGEIVDVRGAETANPVPQTQGELEDGAQSIANPAIEKLNIDPHFLKVLALCNEAKWDEEKQVYEGSATEGALLQLVEKAGQSTKALRETYPLLATKHRSTTHPYMVTLHQDNSTADHYFVAVKGRPQDVIARCKWEWRSSEKDGVNCSVKVELTEERREEIRAMNHSLMDKAYRVLGVAFQEQTTRDVNKTRDLIWLGLTGMADPIRPEVKGLIQEFHQAGIKTVMITGDQAGTARAVGEELGLSQGEPIRVVKADILDDLEAEGVGELIDKAHVFARVSPSMKLQIVQALQGRGYTVAMTGDGINDGPALKVSDVGVAMGASGTEVAHSMSDIVLHDDQLGHLVHGLEEGRTVYKNIQKSIEYLLSTNFSEIQVMLAAIVAGLPVPLSATQLLWINLITDVFPSLALGLEPPEKDVMMRPPIDKDAGMLNNANLKRIVGESFLITSGAFANYFYAQRKYGTSAHANTQIFTALTLAQLLHSYTIKSRDKSLLSAEVPNNNLLNVGTGLSIGLQAATVLVPGLRRFLGNTPMSLTDGLVAVVGAGLPLIFNEGRKLLIATRGANQSVIELPVSSISER